MDAHTQIPHAGSAPAIVPLVPGSRPPRRFSVDEYHRMIETGILTENDRVELLDGWILEMSPIGPPHSVCVGLVAATLQEVLPAGLHLRVQSPVTFQTSEPEPDVTIVKGGIRDFSARHPSGADVALLVEVADSSLAFDRDMKRQQYAVAGICEFWIVNLIDRQLEIYRDPKAPGGYTKPIVLGEADSVPLTIDGKAVGTLRVADLLP